LGRQRLVDDSDLRCRGIVANGEIHTSIPLHLKILADADFRAGRFDTNFIKRFMPAGKG
jgi:biotin carboxylase